MFVKQSAYYCVVVMTTKGSMVLRIEKQQTDFAMPILKALSTVGGKQRPITAERPGLLHFQLGTWAAEVQDGAYTPATVIRGSVSVSSPSLHQACNLLIARSPARSIERLYVHLGFVVGGWGVLDSLSAQDSVLEAYWSEYEPRYEETAEAEGVRLLGSVD